jgi:FMN phosphatase YigB (HAD superfamily)
MPETRAVLLDVWHTLIYMEPADEERYMAAQIDTMAKVLDGWPPSPRGRHPPLHDARKAAEEIRGQAVAAAARGVSTPLAVQALHAARRLGRQVRALELSQALAALVERTPFLLSPGALGMLEELRDRRFRLGVVSNAIGEPGDAVQQVLERAGAGRYIEAWAFSDQLPWTKPAPEIFWHGLGMLETRRERAVHVGDAWADLAGARAAGLRAGILYTGEQNYGATYGRFLTPEKLGSFDVEFQIDKLAALPTLAETLLRE